MFIGHAQQKLLFILLKCSKRRCLQNIKQKGRTKNPKSTGYHFYGTIAKRHIKDCKKIICPTFPSPPSYKNLQALDAGLKNLAIKD